MKRGSIDRGEERTEPRHTHRVKRGSIQGSGWLGTALASVVLLAGLTPAWAQATQPTAIAVLSASTTTRTPDVIHAAPAAAGQPDSVGVTLTSMNPRSPSPADVDQAVTLTATVVNSTDVSYPDFTVGLERGLPITAQSGLDEALANPPATDTLADSHEVDQNKPLPAHSSLNITYRTTSGAMCLCFTGIYPYALVIRTTSGLENGSAELARIQILVPSFLSVPAPVRVSWVWPLVDRPHRWLSETVFNDDELAGSVAKGGRLDRALAVPERTAGQVRMLLVVDPDLLDSLAVMSSPGGYQYRGRTAVIRGTGGQAAASWLARLSALRSKHDIVLTGYADPDIDAATRAGLPWSTALDPQVQARIAHTINDFTSDLTWPAGGALTSKALDAAIAGGSSTVLLSDNALSDQTSGDPRPDAISPLPSAAGRALALVTDSAIENTVDQVLKVGSFAAQGEQALLGQLAMRAVQDGGHSHFVVVTPSRYVDTDPATAAQTVLATVTTSWSKPISVRTALSTVTPVDRGPLRISAASPADEVSAALTAQLVRIERQVASMREALNSDAAAALLGGFGAGLQRGESNAWRTDRARGSALVAELGKAIVQRLGSVAFVRPTDGTYSLSSANSPVIVTVQNKLSQDVSVRVRLSPGPGVVGFRTPPVGTQTINANSTRTISIPAHVDRLGKFVVVATLTTPDGQPLGQAISLNLRATALGGITKTITIVAATVLILALFRRVVLRIRRGHGHQLAAGAAR